MGGEGPGGARPSPAATLPVCGAYACNRLLLQWLQARMHARLICPGGSRCQRHPRC
jgi:hypothetical protein